MRQKLNIIIGLDLFALALLVASGLSEGILSEFFYYAAFLLPIGIGLFLLGRLPARETDALTLLPRPAKTEDSGDDRPLAPTEWLPFAAPILLFIFALAALTALLFSLVGRSDATPLSENAVTNVLLHALLPALFEETLLRYLPLRLLGEDKRCALVYSALFFSLIHCNLFRIPYAFAAGVLFAAMDLAAGCLLPSLILHFVNNLLSLLWTARGQSPLFVGIFIGTAVALSLLSLLLIWKKRKRYFARLSAVFGKKRKLFLSFEPFLFALITLYLAVSAWIL